MISAQRPGRVVIVGGGIAGLAAAFFLRGRGIAVTVLEGSSRLGGKLASSDVAGIAVDEGAEALLARRPEGVDLIRALGLGDELRFPGTTTASIWTRGRFRSLPRRQFMGVPADLSELERSAILSPAGLARAGEDTDLPATTRDGDVSVGAYVGARFGAELVDRLVDPLLGGVYAGRSDRLSFDATIPALAQAARQHASLAVAASTLLGPPADRPEPVFTTLAGGLGTLPQVLAAACGAQVRTGAMVRELTRTQDGWRLTAGSAHAPELIDADAVILALPARPASRLLSGVAGPGGAGAAGAAGTGTAAAAAAASALGEIEYASMAIVTLAYPCSAFPEPIQGSGYLVPAVDGRPVKAVTFSTVKWPHLTGGSLAAESGSPPGAADRGGSGGPPLHLVRCSLGRVGEEAVLQRDDGDLVALAAGELAAATGVFGEPTDSRVSRWGGALPQYTVGHLDRVRRIRDGVAALPGLAVCGAAYDGIGIPACIASARLAAERSLTYLHGAATPARAGE